MDKEDYWKMLLAMPPEERTSVLNTEFVQEEVYILSNMIASNRRIDKDVEFCVGRASYHMGQYESTQQDTSLDWAEMYTDMAKLLKEDRYSIGDIRQQRERVQWQRIQNKKVQKSIEPSEF